MTSTVENPTKKRLSAYAVYTRNNQKKKSIVEPPTDDGFISQETANVPKPHEESLAVEKIEVKADIHAPNQNKSKRGKSRKRKIGEETPMLPVLDSRNGNRKSIGNGLAEALFEKLCEGETSKLTTPSNVVLCGNEAAEEAFKWLINPFNPNLFLATKLDKKPLYIPRKNSTYYHGLFSSEEFNKIIKENSLNYGQEIDVVAYVDNERITVTDEMKVHPSFVWRSFAEGHSIRMRNPQVYDKQLWKICSLLQEYFGSSVGVNMYLTPAGSQGFPPHYDDIDAFILQIEGRKRWKLYKPRSTEEILPRYSSADMTENEIDEPYMEVEVKEGDCLYFPRGFIHQAMATENAHSLHLTISCNQLNTWGDLLLAGVTHAVEKAIKNEVDLRKTLPKDYMNYLGASYADCDTLERKQFEEQYKEYAEVALKYLSVDQAADDHAADFIYGSMPPFFDKKERARSIHGNGSQLKNGKVLNSADLTPETKIRLIRKRAFRLVMDDENIKLYHSLGNSKSFKESDPLFTEIDFDAVPAINMLFKKHPEYIKVEDLPADSSFQLQLAQQLYDNGFLMTEEPLPLSKTQSF